ncbi:hypothetical protein FP828_03730 [bacterium]|nr:hypothetical protein [Candidatus Omnitrophota bacterium]MBA3065583.1 hypothetical protein [bacterium]
MRDIFPGVLGQAGLNVWKNPLTRMMELEIPGRRVAVSETDLHRYSMQGAWAEQAVALPPSFDGAYSQEILSRMMMEMTGVPSDYVGRSKSVEPINTLEKLRRDFENWCGNVLNEE